ncbi:hypothetical protein HCN44_004774 [Aphidius gifuensis]|uniref:Uncharacterized protein n=1 Tax=Aphidius gifuensis TaxID=684658 RepID=A0A834XIW0_APHGI|nr:hypothetical protein HCN44_004774 [Aphidius gifuensis]
MQCPEQDELDQEPSGEATVPLPTNQEETVTAAVLTSEGEQAVLQPSYPEKTATATISTPEASRGVQVSAEKKLYMVKDTHDDLYHVEDIVVPEDSRIPTPGGSGRVQVSDKEELSLVKDTHTDLHDVEEIMLPEEQQQLDMELEDDDNDDADTVILEPEEMNGRLKNVDYYNYRYIPREVSRRGTIC